MCKLLVDSRSGYYAWLVRPQSARAKQNAHLLELIKDSYEASGKTYGSNRVFFDLREAGETCSFNLEVIVVDY